MAHHIEATDHIMLAGAPAWHGLGTVLPTRTDAITALKTARLEWTVEVAPVTATLTDGRTVDGGDNRLVVRSDTGEAFAACKDGYQPIQNAEIADLAYEISNFSDRAVETAGSLRGGRKVWFLVDMGTIYAAADDKVKPYLFIGAAHDLSMSLTIGSIATRVVCANTHAIAMREVNGDCVKIKHTASAEQRLAKVREWLAGPTASIKAYGATAIRMAEQGITDEQLQAFFTSVWQRANGRLTDEDIRNPKSRRAQKYQGEVSQWLANFRDDKRQTGVSTNGSVWAALNAVTQYANHERTVRNEKQDASRRLDSVLFGTAGDLNKAAYEAAAALVA